MNLQSLCLQDIDKDYEKYEELNFFLKSRK